MKKTISVIMLIILSMVVLSCMCITNAQTMQPEYDATFNNNNGIFYANGNNIEIKQNSSGETVVVWEEGTQIVPSTVTIIGGGKAGTSYESSNIIMNSGTVSLIYGGGCSLVEDSSADVEKSNVTINGGSVLTTVYGGGLIYSSVDESNVTINAGTVSAVCGGGAASASISGIAYSAGTEAEPQNSKNRVNVANLTINGGTIDSTPSNYGTVFGGGQGYSFVGTANLTINNGNLSKAYVTTGGSNGYTGKSTTIITGGNIKIFQTVNRGILENAKVKITNGNIEKAYIGGETDPTVTGKVNKVEVDILGGKINELLKGTSNGVELNIDQDAYKAIYVDGTVTQSSIGEKEIKIKYTINILEEKIKVYKWNNQKVVASIATIPSGYEYLFDNEEKIWSSDNKSIATVDSDGVIKAVTNGETVIRVNLLEQTDNVIIQVTSNPKIIALLVIAAILFGYLIFILISRYN